MSSHKEKIGSSVTSYEIKYQRKEVVGYASGSPVYKVTNEKILKTVRQTSPLQKKVENKHPYRKRIPIKNRQVVTSYRSPYVQRVIISSNIKAQENHDTSVKSEKGGPLKKVFSNIFKK